MIILATTRFRTSSVNEHYVPFLFLFFIFLTFPLLCGLAAIIQAVYTVTLLCCILFYNVTCAVDPFQCWAETSNTTQSEWRHPVLQHRSTCSFFEILCFWVWIYFPYSCPCMACIAPWMQKQFKLMWQFACSHIPRCKVEKHLGITVLLTCHCHLKSEIQAVLLLLLLYE